MFEEFREAAFNDGLRVEKQGNFFAIEIVGKQKYVLWKVFWLSDLSFETFINVC